MWYRCIRWWLRWSCACGPHIKCRRFVKDDFILITCVHLLDTLWRPLKQINTKHVFFGALRRDQNIRIAEYSVVARLCRWIGLWPLAASYQIPLGTLSFAKSYWLAFHDSLVKTSTCSTDGAWPTEASELAYWSNCRFNCMHNLQEH